jgi:hypothetical protein
MCDPPQRDEPDLEALRRGSGLRFDRDGVWWHEGGRVLHPRIAQVLSAGIDRHPQSGEYIVRVGREWCYVEVEDAPVIVRGAHVTGDEVRLLLSDGTEEALTPTELRFDAEGVLHTWVRGGRLPARFSRAAYHALLDLFAEEGGVAWLQVGGRRYPVTRS